MFKRSFWEVGQWLQGTAKTEEEAKQRFESSCSKCNKSAFCNEKLCPIAKTHEIKLLILETAKFLEGRKPCAPYKPRKYKKSTPEGNAKKAILNFLTRLSKEVTKRKVQLIIDDASVMAELGELESCYWILRNGKLFITAERVKNIIKSMEDKS